MKKKAIKSKVQQLFNNFLTEDSTRHTDPSDTTAGVKTLILNIILQNNQQRVLNIQVILTI